MIELIKAGRQLSLHDYRSVLNRFSRESKTNGVLVETCDRTEWYRGDGEVPEWIVRHLFSVTSGLKSTLVGESAIQGQVKRAYAKAQKQNDLSKGIHQLFQASFYVSKRVRRETELSTGAMSHSQATVQLIRDTVTDLKGKHITLIGANYLNENIIKYLVKKGADTLFLGNRTYDKAAKIARKYNSRAFKFDQFEKILEQTDILISATSAVHLILKKERFPKNKSMVIFDLAVPRDIDPEIGELEQVSLFDIGAIEQRILQNINTRQEEVSKAEAIIEEETEKFLADQSRNRFFKKQVI